MKNALTTLLLVIILAISCLIAGFKRGQQAGMEKGFDLCIDTVNGMLIEVSKRKDTIIGKSVLVSSHDTVVYFISLKNVQP